MAVVHAHMCVCLPLQLKHHFLSSKTSIATFIYTHPPIYPSTPSSTENPAVSPPLRCAGILSSFTLTQTIYLHTPVSPFTYFYMWIHMSLSSAFTPQVGLHINHHLILHRQPGCFPYGPEDGGAHRVSRRPGRSDGNRVWHHAWRIHNDLLSGQRMYTALHTIVYTLKLQPHTQAYTLRLT